MKFQMMTGQSTCEYVVLGYGSNPLLEPDFPIAVVAREVGPDAAPGLMLHVGPMLENVGQRHLDYLHELFGDWLMQTSNELDAFFLNISELSTEALRTQEAGNCPLHCFPQLVDRILGSRF